MYVTWYVWGENEEKITIDIWVSLSMHKKLLEGVIRKQQWRTKTGSRPMEDRREADFLLTVYIVWILTMKMLNVWMYLFKMILSNREGKNKCQAHVESISTQPGSG